MAALNMKSPLERFWMCVNKTATCWLWTGYLELGYGRFRTGKGKRMNAHRFSYQLHKGSIPPGLLVCHKCDTPACVNPDHLFLGTPQANVDDMHRKNRWKRPRNHFLAECKNGHPRNVANFKLYAKGRYRCVLCVKHQNAKADKKYIPGGVSSQP